jgi:hypothetical protein
VPDAFIYSSDDVPVMHDGLPEVKPRLIATVLADRDRDGH